MASLTISVLTGSIMKLPTSSRETFKSASMRATIRLLALYVSFVYTFCFKLSLPASSERSISEYQLIAVSGVRSWCDARETNSVLALSTWYSLVTSRNETTQPTISPEPLRIGAIELATGILFPSADISRVWLRLRMISFLFITSETKSPIGFPSFSETKEITLSYLKPITLFAGRPVNFSAA